MTSLIIACLAATWLIWGSTYLAIKWALVSLPPFFQMGTRFIAAALLLGAWARCRQLDWPNRTQIGLILGVALGGEVVSRMEWQAAAVISVGVVVLLLGKQNPAGAGR